MFKCPCCGCEISPAQISAYYGSVKSDAKSKAAQENGKKGGRPKGSKNKEVKDAVR